MTFSCTCKYCLLFPHDIIMGKIMVQVPGDTCMYMYRETCLYRSPWGQNLLVTTSKIEAVLTLCQPMIHRAALTLCQPKIHRCVMVSPQGNISNSMIYLVVHLRIKGSCSGRGAPARVPSSPCPAPSTKQTTKGPSKSTVSKT